MGNIRTEKSKDYQEIGEVTGLAFGSEDEVRLIEWIRKSDHFIPELSLVYEKDGNIVGHILFSGVTIETGDRMVSALVLLIVSVRPDYQNQGIGSELVRRGFEECRSLGHGVVVVIGHPLFYPRFGFVPAVKKGLTVEFDCPDEAFMVVELFPEAMDFTSGTVKYPPEFV